MKKKLQFIYPAVFVRDEEDSSYQVIFPDLNIYTHGENVTKAFMNAKDLLSVFFSYAVKYETDFNAPSKIQEMVSRCKKNEIIMLIDTVVEVER